MAYWRSLPAEKLRNCAVYVYQLFPKLSFPPGEHAIEVIAGETPLGGASGDATQAALDQFGLGDYWFQMKYTPPDKDKGKVITMSWLRGYSDALSPDWLNFRDHPPLKIRDARKHVVLDDEKNQKSGYIEYLRSVGQLPGAAVEENATMAQEQQGMNSVAAAAITSLGNVVSEVIRKPEKEPPKDPQPAVSPYERGMEFVIQTADKMVDKAGDVYRQNSINAPELVKVMLDAAKPSEEVTRMVERAAEQNQELQKSVIEMHRQRADDARDEVRALRSDVRMLLEKMSTPANPQTPPPPPQDPVEAIVGVAEKFERVRSIFGGGRRRRDDDDDYPPRREPERPWWTELLAQLPALVTAGGGILTTIAVLQNNHRVMATGEGTFIDPATAGFRAPNPPQQQHSVTMPAPAITGPQPPQDDANRAMFELAQFAQRIEPGLIGAFERNESGYEYAELFIRSFGRVGPWAYNEVRECGKTELAKSPFVTQKAGELTNVPWPESSARVVQALLSYYPPIASKIGSNPKLTEFLIAFMSYDEFLADAGVHDLKELYREYDVGSVEEYLALPEAEETPATPEIPAAVIPPAVPDAPKPPRNRKAS